MVKKNLVVPTLVGILLTAMILSGCTSSKAVVWDDLLPEEETTTIVYGPGHEIKMYNGIPMKLPKKVFSFVKIQLPAGETELIFNYKDGARQGADLRIVYYFEAGKIYGLDLVAWGEDGYTIGLRDWETRKIIDHIPILFD